MRVDNIFHEQEVPYYIPCMYPLVHEYLKNNNLNSYLSLHLNIELLGLPSFCKNEDMTSFKVNISAYNAKRLGYKSRGEYLGFALNRKECRDQKEGLELLKSMIKCNNAVIVSGSQFHIPYCINYKNVNYIKKYPNPLFGVVNHWVNVYGIENKEVLIRDTTFNYWGIVQIEDFLEFWKGDKYIDGLKNFPGVSGLLENGYVDVKVSSNLSAAEFKEFFMRTILTIACEYITGEHVNNDGLTYYFGKAALEELYNSIAFPTELKREVLESFSSCLYNLRFNRFIFRDLLLEMKNIFGGAYEEQLNDFNEIVSKLEDVAYIYAVNLKRNRINFDIIQMILVKFRDYIEAETIFFEKLIELHKGFVLLEKV